MLIRHDRKAGNRGTELSAGSLAMVLEIGIPNPLKACIFSGVEPSQGGLFHINHTVDIG
jgi:hypothetical protein